MTHGDPGTLDEALDRLHLWGPEREGWLTNHAPMTVEALTRHGHGAAVHRWLDHYQHKLERLPPRHTPVDDSHDTHWRNALGDPRRLTDWIEYFGRQLTEQPWQAVLAFWWPRLLPGITGGSTHPVIRTGHAVRTLLASDERGPTGPRTAELAHALGYWAARHAPLPRWRPSPASRSALAALAAVPRAPDQSGGMRHRLPQITALPDWPGATDVNSPAVPGLLTELVAAATRHYAHHAHGEPVMLVHAVTAPNAVARTLPALPERLWPSSLAAAWEASAAVVAAYTPAESLEPRLTSASAAETFARAVEHGDEHAVKLADSALDVLEDPLSRAAAVRACELIPPIN